MVVLPHLYRHLSFVIVTLAIPVGGVFLTLAIFGWLAPVSAVVCGVIAVALIILLIRPYGHDLALFTLYVRDLAQAPDTPAPNMRTAMAADLVAAMGQLRRANRQQAEDRERSLQFHETLFDSLPDPLLLLNDHRRVVRANLAARNIFGRQVQGRDLSAVLRHPTVLDAVERVIAGEVGRETEFSLGTPADHDFRVRIEPLPNPGADGTRAVISLHDITALKRMEQMRADFIANASHELRTPLSAILGFIETLRGPARDDEEARDRFLGIMYEQASRMSRLVADLLNLSRIELNEHTTPASLCDVSEILCHVAEGLLMQARSRKMDIDLDLSNDLPPVNGQQDELMQIFQNLIDNSLKYGHDGTTVEVSVRLVDVKDLPPVLSDRGQRFLAVDVRDHSDGIARENIPRLTERFFRVDTARSRRLGGTGLGLAIVKHIVNRHRGFLHIDSVLGEGSVFTVFLPIADDERKTCATNVKSEG